MKNILFLSLSVNIDPKKDNGIYGSILHELSKKNRVFIVSPIQRREHQNTYIIKEQNYQILKVKIGNITKCNKIEKGISTLLIQTNYKNAIKKHFRNVKFDLILYATPPITLCNVIKYFKKRDNAKTYLMLKDIFPQNAVDLKMFSKKSIIYKYFRSKEKKLYKLSDNIGCMSPKNKEYILNHNNYLDENKIEVFPNSINAKKQNFRNLELNKKYRKKYNIPLNSRVFLYGGNLGKPQGIPFIIDCLKSVSSIESVYFVICGTGTEYKKLEEFKNNSNIPNLLLINGLPKKEYTELLNVADVGLIFLDYKFTIPNFPSRILSYMEKGIPILACTDPNTDVGDIIEKNNFGWKCYSNNSENLKKIIKKICLYDDKKLVKYGQKGYDYLLKNYSSNVNYSIISNKICKSTKHIWIGGVAPEERFKELVKMGDRQHAANNVQLLYIDGIEKNTKEKMTIISSHFIPYFFKNKILFFKKKLYDNWIEISFINLPILKQICKSVNVAKELKRIIKENNNCDFIVYIYAMTTPLMFSAKTINKLIKKYNTNIKTVQIVPDLPEYMNFSKRNVLWRIAKKVDRKIIKGLMRYINKYVLFSSHMAQKLNLKKSEFITIEGMVSSSSNIINTTKEKVIMYAGGINEAYGIYDLIDTFGNLNIKDYELHLYGPCTNREELEKKIKSFNNIKYFGTLPKEKIVELESKAMILVNPRKASNDFTKYSFPSKTMEYLLSGTPIIMYKLKGIPDEYDNYIFYIDDTKSDGLKEKMQELCSKEYAEIEKIGKLGQDFVVKNKNNVIQCKKIIDWLVISDE